MTEPAVTTSEPGSERQPIILFSTSLINLGIPLDSNSKRAGGHPVRAIGSVFSHAVEMAHESRKVFEPSPEGIDLMDRQLQPDRFADMHTAIAAQRLLCVAIRPERAKWLRPVTDECAVEERD